MRNDHYFSFIGVGSDKNLKDIDVEKLFKEKASKIKAQAKLLKKTNKGYTIFYIMHKLDINCSSLKPPN